MVTISIPINFKQEKFINSLVKSGIAANKAHAVRLAVDKYQEDRLINDILESERDIKAGRIFRGDLNEIVKKFND
ncbi:MAG: hypothetical protein Q7R72_01370 [bacterium]|nr:hypothetical protein [bacterium]